jgi:hypothetical protein
MALPGADASDWSSVQPDSGGAGRHHHHHHQQQQQYQQAQMHRSMMPPGSSDAPLQALKHPSSSAAPRAPAQQLLRMCQLISPLTGSRRACGPLPLPRRDLAAHCGIQQRSAQGLSTAPASLYGSPAQRHPGGPWQQRRRQPVGRKPVQAAADLASLHSQIF